MTNDIISIAKNKDTDGHLVSKSKLLNKLEGDITVSYVFSNILVWNYLDSSIAKGFAY